MKIVIYANVDKDWRDRIRTPYGIAQFRSYISRNFITADQPYTHPCAKAVSGDIIVWAFKDENGTWQLLGDAFVSNKWKIDKEDWGFAIEGARLYPRNVPLDDLSFADSARKALNVGYPLDWKQYREILEKASEPLVS
jgi:hypothetical protein